MKKRLFLVITSLLFLGQGAWADEATKSFPLHDATNNPEDGTEAHPYQIWNESDLNTLASDVNSGTKYEGKYFLLINNLDYSQVDLFDSDNDGVADSNFTPIGWGDVSEGAPFQGIFEGGNNTTITGITVNTPKNYGVGLFGHVRNASIKNLTLKNCSFTGNTSVGVLVGYCQNPANTKNYYQTIENCHVTGTSSVTGKELNEDITIRGEDLGGLIGYVDNRIIISNCTSNATVSTESKKVESVGGIIGEIGADDSDPEYFVTVTDCYYLGTNLKPIGYKTTKYTIKLTLLDNDSDNDSDSEETVKNATRLANYDGETCNVTLSGRTLYRDGYWNTLCLPFDLTISGSVLDGATVMKLTNDASFSNGTLTLNFTSVDKIEAGKPYIIKWGTPKNHPTDNIENPTFEDVMLENELTPVVTTDVITFTGTYGYQSFTDTDNTILFLGEGSKLYYPSADVTIGACRAYFQLADGITAGDPTASQIRAFVLNFDEDTNAITTINADNKTTGWYDLNGIKLNEAPATRGMYIHDGKKVMIK